MVTTRSGTKITVVKPPEPIPVEEKRKPAPKTSRTPKRPRTSTKSKRENEEIEISPRGFTAIPVETFTEISSYLQPGDLISLARTCKNFRAILMKSSADNIWRRSEMNVPKLPEYPWSNMSPPRYAALLFTKNCTVCGENTTSNADPYLLVRLCAVCRETELVEIVGRDYRWKEPMRLVCKTTLMHFRKKDAKKRPRGSGLLKYCLRKELEEIETTFKALSQSGCVEALARWKKEVQDEVRLRKEFGERVLAFSNHNDAIRSRELADIRRERIRAIEERLLDLGWTEDDITFRWPTHRAWTALVEQPRPLTDRVWANLFPKLVPLLEANRAEIEASAQRTRKHERQTQVHKLLRQHKLSTHPLAPMVRALGFEPMLREPKNGPTPAVITNFLECYPFPESHAAIKWPCFADLNEREMSQEEVKESFERSLEEVRENVDREMRIVETDLVLKLLSAWDEWDKDYETRVKYMVQVKDSEDSTKDLPDLTRLLLRADTVFSRSAPDSATGQGSILYYPEFVPSNSTFARYTYSWNQPPKFSAKGYHPHFAGEAIAQALLACIGMPDVAYLELAAMGERFVCGRCFMTKPMTWKGMLQHYLDEAQTIDRMRATGPRFKTRHPVQLVNAHDLDPASYPTPLVELMSAEEADQMRATPPGTANEHGPEYCIPCKNHGRMFVSNVVEQMDWHVQKVHDVQRLTRDVHYGLISDLGTFLEIGGIWKENWDTHYDRVAAGHEPEEGDEPEVEALGHDDLVDEGIHALGAALQGVAGLFNLNGGGIQFGDMPFAVPMPTGFLYETDSEEEYPDSGLEWGEDEDEDVDEDEDMDEDDDEE